MINDAALTQRSLPSLQRVAGKDNVRTISLQTTAEDFSYFGQQVPSLLLLGRHHAADRDPQTRRVQPLAAVLSRRSGDESLASAPLLALTTEYLAQ